MKIVFVLSKKAIKPDYIPRMEDLIKERRVIKETRQGLRLCAVEAPADFEGYLYMRQHYHFFESRAELFEAIARQSNEATAELERLKLSATSLMCDAHDLLRGELVK